jgi:hypothetical protein
MPSLGALRVVGFSETSNSRTFSAVAKPIKEHSIMHNTVNLTKQSGI